MSGPVPRDDLNRDEIARAQSVALAALCAEVLPGHPFYARKLAGIDLGRLSFPADLARLPFTTKGELLASQAERPPYGGLLSFPAERYSRLHQTSGTSGRGRKSTAESGSPAMLVPLSVRGHRSL